jgi:hypothetical protein
MKIDVKDSVEFKCLLEALVDELIDAHDHLRLHQGLVVAIPLTSRVQSVGGILDVYFKCSHGRHATAAL